MPEIVIDADVSSAIRKISDGMEVIKKAAKQAASGVGAVGDSYEKAAVSAERFAASVKKSQSQQNAQQKSMENSAKLMRQWSEDAQKKQSATNSHGIDRRVAMANLSQAARGNTWTGAGERIQQAAGEAWQSNTLAGGVGEAGAAIASKITPMAVGLASVTVGLLAVKLALDKNSEYYSKQGALSEDMGKRRIQLGQDAASLGMSGDDLAKAQTGTGKSSVQQREAILHSLAASNNARPLGAPRIGKDGVNKILAASASTGLDLSNAAENPGAVDGNIDQFLNMEIVKRGADISSLSGRRGNGPQGNYNKKLPADAAGEMKLRSDLSNVDDAPGKNADPAAGVQQRIFDAHQSALDKGGGTGNFIKRTSLSISHWIDPSGTNRLVSSGEVDSGNVNGDMLKELQTANDQRAEQFRKASMPRPAVIRDGDTRDPGR